MKGGRREMVAGREDVHPLQFLQLLLLPPSMVGEVGCEDMQPMIFHCTFLFLIQDREIANEFIVGV
jgi:hypothetical protein